MPRQARLKSGSGYYHIFIRGINRQVIFADDQDRRKFLKIFKTVKKDSDFKVIAWCLMTNHFHLLLGTGTDSISDIIKRINISYVSYYNKRHGRVGALFQDRFGSEPVESEDYFVNVCRYILQNPSKAGIAPVDNYYWSSYREYTGQPFITDCSILLKLLNGVNNFIQYVKKPSDDIFLDCPPFSSTSEIAALLLKDLKSSDIRTFYLLDTQMQKEMLEKWLKQGITIRQIADSLNTKPHKLYYIHQKI